MMRFERQLNQEWVLEFRHSQQLGTVLTVLEASETKHFYSMVDWQLMIGDQLDVLGVGRLLCVWDVLEAMVDSWIVVDFPSHGLSMRSCIVKLLFLIGTFVQLLEPKVFVA